MGRSGAAAGAGVSLALGGDFMVCADNAKFILAFVNLGLVPDTGATYLLAKAIGTARTMELAATGRPVTAQEAKDWGLAYQVVPVEELDAATMKLARKLATGPLISYKNIKKQLYSAVYADYKQWLDETEVPTQRECAASLDFQEGCKAFMEKRKAVFQIFFIGAVYKFFKSRPAKSPAVPGCHFILLLNLFRFIHISVKLFSCYQNLCTICNSKRTPFCQCHFSQPSNTNSGICGCFITSKDFSFP